jgi:hypothetical protein
MKNYVKLSEGKNNIYTQRFHKMMKLIKIDFMLRNARIEYPEKKTLKNGYTG